MSETTATVLTSKGDRISKRILNAWARKSACKMPLLSTLQKRLGATNAAAIPTTNQHAYNRRSLAVQLTIVPLTWEASAYIG